MPFFHLVLFSLEHKVLNFPTGIFFTSQIVTHPHVCHLPAGGARERSVFAQLEGGDFEKKK
jgi:hypothetical protein